MSSRQVASDWLRANKEAFTTDQLSSLSISMQDFLGALKKFEALPFCDDIFPNYHRVQPSAKREGFATTPEVTWEDVGALGDPRRFLSLYPTYVLLFISTFRELEEAITFPLVNPELCKRLGIESPPV